MSMSLPNDMRKYGRRGAKRNTDGSVHDSNIQSDSTTRARKRQKIVVEVVARDPTSPSLSRGV